MILFLILYFFEHPPEVLAREADASNYNAQSKYPSKNPQKIEKHSFSGLRLKGQYKKPELSYIYQRKGLRAEQIVNIPEEFDGDIKKGAKQF